MGRRLILKGSFGGHLNNDSEAPHSYREDRNPYSRTLREGGAGFCTKRLGMVWRTKSWHSLEEALAVVSAVAAS